MSDQTPGLPTTVAEALRQAHALGLDRLDAHLLLGTALQRPRTWLLAHDQDALPREAAERFITWARRRADGEPLAYLVGDKEFYGLTLSVGPDVLIPRPDTETLVDWALALMPPTQPLKVLDLGTGSGAIALALKHHRPQAAVTAVDASAAALSTARENASRLGQTIELLHGSWFEPVSERRFDLVVSNPPYIAEHDSHLNALRFEPKQALTSGPDGLDDIRLILAQARAHLEPGAWLLFEHGFDQADAVAQWLHQHGFGQIATRRDLGGNPRCTGGQSPS